MADKWQVEFLNYKAFERVLNRLSSRVKNKVFDRVLKGLVQLGPDSVASGQSRALGGGLYEFRVALPPEVLLRVFSRMSAGE